MDPMSTRGQHAAPLIAPATTGSVTPTILPPPTDPLGPHGDPAVVREAPRHQLDREVAEGDQDLLDPGSKEQE